MLVWKIMFSDQQAQSEQRQTETDSRKQITASVSSSMQKLGERYSCIQYALHTYIMLMQVYGKTDIHSLARGQTILQVT